ncbi:MAG: hypothetical protein CL942_08595 [Desulfovibrio sp.]|nr:hypothetical protein [Desulfovibrio sp.]
MAQLKEYDTIRLLEAQEGPGHYSQGVVHTVPVGTEGTILEVFDQGASFEVEFTIREPEFDGDELLHTGTFHIITLKPGQIAPA